MYILYTAQFTCHKLRHHLVFLSSCINTIINQSARIFSYFPFLNKIIFGPMEHPRCFCCFVIVVSQILKSSQTITFLQNDTQVVVSYLYPSFVFSDSSFFHLPALSTDNGSQSTVFGVSCFKQIDSKVCLLCVMKEKF